MTPHRNPCGICGAYDHPTYECFLAEDDGVDQEHIDWLAQCEREEVEEAARVNRNLGTEEVGMRNDTRPQEHRIFLDALSGSVSKPAIPAGYFGPVPGVGMNEFIYCRVSREKAWTFVRGEAIRQVMSMRDKGYPAKCEPPVTVTF